jgi:signal-transduction protein with cAMP-binding, CBS, and nucleotidyltransferase domain
MSDPTEQTQAGHLVEFEQGDYIFREGDLGTEMYVIHQGRVEILKRIEGGETQLAVFEQGDFFGELSLLDDEPRSASVRALEDTVVVAINGATFVQMLTETPEIAVRMMRKLSGRLRATDKRLQDAMGHASASSARAPAEAPSAPPPPPPPAETPVQTPSAVYSLIDRSSGVVFNLSEGVETTVGRSDPVTGISPTVDLTSIDTDRSSSRRHAKILRRDGKFYVVEEIGTMNGTFVNGRRVETGVPVQIRPGNEVRFGVLEFEFIKA